MDQPAAEAGSDAAARPEPRWPVMLAILVVLSLLAWLPGRVRLLPPWVVYVLTVAVLAPIAVVSLRPHSTASARTERWMTLSFTLIAALANLGVLRALVLDMVADTHTVGGLQLLTSSIAVWATNVLMFSLLYWQLDRGGPAGRAGGASSRPDWIFPQDQPPPGALRPGWRPQFLDYLFLAYSTATAFSTTDVAPLTSRAKLLMMAESAISLVTLVVVAARAINLLGG